jgi:hypothetical protein
MRGFMKASYALAFERVSVRPSQTQHVRFTLSAHDLGMVNEEGARLAAAGDSKRFVGGSQFGTGAAGTELPLKIQGEQKLARQTTAEPCGSAYQPDPESAGMNRPLL